MSESTSARENEIFNTHYEKLTLKTDTIFACLLIFQWLLGIFFAVWISPQTWIGGQDKIHIHVYAAILLGGIATALPVFLALKRRGHYSNRFVMAGAQMFFSVMFIHLTGGRIETHFHVFGSLAFLAFYRDYRPVLLATVITGLDHLLRGIYWPESVYGVLSASPLRAFEHAGWVLFEDTILFISIRNGLEELRALAGQQAQVESTLERVEHLAQVRAQELSEAQKTVLEQKERLVLSSKMSALGEMASGIAHEINTPLAIISMRVDEMNELMEEGQLTDDQVKTGLRETKATANRIANIVRGLRMFSQDGQRAEPQMAGVYGVVEDTLSFCTEKFAENGVTLKFKVNASVKDLQFECRPTEISQVLLNLLNNAYDAVSVLSEKWIRIHVDDLGDDIEISVIDSGTGISKEIQENVMKPFYTTKDVGKGTGLGLSISKGIVESHGGTLAIDNESPNTRFKVRLPKLQRASNSVDKAA